MLFKFNAEFREFVKEDYDFNGKQGISRKIKIMAENDNVFKINVPEDKEELASKLVKSGVYTFECDGFLNYPWKKNDTNSQYYDSSRPFSLDKSGNKWQLSFTLINVTKA